jgi:hypothetical protein
MLTKRRNQDTADKVYYPSRVPISRSNLGKCLRSPFETTHVNETSSYCSQQYNTTRARQMHRGAAGAARALQVGQQPQAHPRASIGRLLRLLRQNRSIYPHCKSQSQNLNKTKLKKLFC